MGRCSLRPDSKSKTDASEAEKQADAIKPRQKIGDYLFVDIGELGGYSYNVTGDPFATASLNDSGQSNADSDQPESDKAQHVHTAPAAFVALSSRIACGIVASANRIVRLWKSNTHGKVGPLRVFAMSQCTGTTDASSFGRHKSIARSTSCSIAPLIDGIAFMDLFLVRVEFRGGGWHRFLYRRSRLLHGAGLWGLGLLGFATDQN